MIEAIRQRRFAGLLITLFLVAVLHPSLGRVNGGVLVLDIYLSLVMITITAAVADRRGTRWISIALCIPAVVATWASFAVDQPATHIVALAVQLAFFGFSGIVVLSNVLGADRVTVDKICGGICVYLLMGVCWGLLYSMIETIHPGSFQVNIDPSGDGTDSSHIFSTMSYFSFVTLSTLGYGDVTPITAPARTFSWLEAVTGQIYLTVLVARLVGMHIAHQGAGIVARGE